MRLGIWTFVFATKEPGERIRAPQGSTSNHNQYGRGRESESGKPILTGSNVIDHRSARASQSQTNSSLKRSYPSNVDLEDMRIKAQKSRSGQTPNHSVNSQSNVRQAPYQHSGFTNKPVPAPVRAVAPSKRREDRYDSRINPNFGNRSSPYQSSHRRTSSSTPSLWNSSKTSTSSSSSPTKQYWNRNGRESYSNPQAWSQSRTYPDPRASRSVSRGWEGNSSTSHVDWNSISRTSGYSGQVSLVRSTCCHLTLKVEVTFSQLSDYYLLSFSRISSKQNSSNDHWNHSAPAIDKEELEEEVRLLKLLLEREKLLVSEDRRGVRVFKLFSVSTDAFFFSLLSAHSPGTSKSTTKETSLLEVELWSQKRGW